MATKIKSADEVIADFLENLRQDSKVDPKITDLICELHNKGELTKTKILGRLDAMRENDADLEEKGA